MSGDKAPGRAGAQSLRDGDGLGGRVPLLRKNLRIVGCFAASSGHKPFEPSAASVQELAFLQARA